MLASMVVPYGAAAQRADVLLTAPERTEYRETTRYDDVMAFLRAVDSMSARIHLTTFGYTLEGRALPLAVVGDVADASPAAVRAAGGTRVYLQGNIHAGEVEGKEVLLMLLRELAEGGAAQWSDSLVLLVAPIYNADGNERVRLTNRPRQHGPIGGMGQRPNAQDYDLNRDHMKLDSPEARSLARMIASYDPHVLVDLHTTNGTRHAYHLTYSPPLHPSTDTAIVGLLRSAWLPTITADVRREHGVDLYYYGNVQGQGEDRGWYTFDHRPRFSNNYAGLRNRVGILSEAYAYAPFEERIAATRWFVEGVIEFAARNGARIREIVRRADAAPLAGQRLALRAGPRRGDTVEILMGEVSEERNPYTGAVMLRRLDVRRPERMPEYGTFEPTEFERVPAAYLVPPDLGDVIANLEAHGVAVTPLERDSTLRVERFRIDSTHVAERPFQGHQERTFFGAYEAATITVPAGTLVVATAQPLGRLAFHLLEPRSDDGLANWNLLDRAIESASHYPIARVHEPPR